MLDLSEHVAASLGLQLINEYGLNYICFQPLFSTEGIQTFLSYSKKIVAVIQIKEETMDAFIQGLISETSLIDTTLKYSLVFKKALGQYPGLINVKVNDFVGLGAVRYIPSYLSSSSDPVSLYLFQTL